MFKRSFLSNFQWFNLLLKHIKNELGLEVLSS